MAVPIDKRFEAVRRIASIQRWLSTLQYILIYPESDVQYAGWPGQDATDKDLVADWLIRRIKLHSTIVEELLTEIDLDPKE